MICSWEGACACFAYQARERQLIKKKNWVMRSKCSVNMDFYTVWISSIPTQTPAIKPEAATGLTCGEKFFFLKKHLCPRGLLLIGVSFTSQYVWQSNNFVFNSASLSIFYFILFFWEYSPQKNLKNSASNTCCLKSTTPETAVAPQAAVINTNSTSLDHTLQEISQKEG